MTKVTIGNHASALVPTKEREAIRDFYCNVLGAQIAKADPARDFIRLGDGFHIAFLYGEVDDACDFARTERSIWLEIKSDNVEATSRAILAFGARRLHVPDPHLYFQAPGGQCLRLVGMDEDLSFYEGAGDGPNVDDVTSALDRSTDGSPPLRAP